MWTDEDGVCISARGQTDDLFVTKPAFKSEIIKPKPEWAECKWAVIGGSTDTKI